MESVGVYGLCGCKGKSKMKCDSRWEITAAGRKHTNSELRLRKYGTRHLKRPLLRGTRHTGDWCICTCVCRRLRLHRRHSWTKGRGLKECFTGDCGRTCGAGPSICLQAPCWWPWRAATRGAICRQEEAFFWCSELVHALTCPHPSL